MLSSLVKEHQTKQAIKKEELGKWKIGFDLNHMELSVHV